MPGKPDLVRLAKLKPSLANGGVWAFLPFTIKTCLWAH